MNLHKLSIGPSSTYYDPQKAWRNLQKDLSLVFFDLSPLVASKTNLSFRRTRMLLSLMP